MAGSFKVTLSLRAASELDDILKYLLSSYGETVARAAYEAINKKLEAIEFMPTAFPPYSPENRTFNRSYRYAIANKSYRLIYTIIVEKEIARVLTIRHVKSDPGLAIQAVEEE